MMGDIFWERITKKHQTMLERKTGALARKIAGVKPRRGKSLKVRLLFSMCKMQHKMVLKSETEPSLDNQYYIAKGWIKDYRYTDKTGG